MERNYTIERNTDLYMFDSRLSLKAKGVMALMSAYLTYNEPPIFSLSDISKYYCDGITAFNNAIKELEQCGYFERTLGKRGFSGGSSPWSYVLKV